MADADNADTNSSDIIFTTKYTKKYVPAVILSTKDNQQLSKLLSKGFGRLVYCNEYKRKMTYKYRNFFESNFVGVSRLFVLFYSNEDPNAKRFKTRSII